MKKPKRIRERERQPAPRERERVRDRQMPLPLESRVRERERQPRERERVRRIERKPLKPIPEDLERNEKHTYGDTAKPMWWIVAEDKNGARFRSTAHHANGEKKARSLFAANFPRLQIVMAQRFHGNRG